MGGAAPLPELRQTVAQVFIRLRAGKEGVAQGAQVKACTSDEKSQMPACFNLSNPAFSLARPLAGSVIDLGRHEIDEVMWYASSPAQRNLRRRNLNLAINLNGITIDNLATEMQSQRNSELAFPGGRRAGDGQYGLL
jgi:hypothetical protein